MNGGGVLIEIARWGFCGGRWSFAVAGGLLRWSFARAVVFCGGVLHGRWSFAMVFLKRPPQKDHRQWAAAARAWVSPRFIDTGRARHCLGLLQE
jgi:hypothetical protein